MDTEDVAPLLPSSPETELVGKDVETNNIVDSYSDSAAVENEYERNRNIVVTGEALTLQVRHWQEVVSVLFQHFHDPDIEAVRGVYAAVAAHRLPGAPVWLMLIGPPGSMKTEVVTALLGIDQVHLVDEVTPNTFISGQIQQGNERDSSSLLHRIGKSGILIFPDFSTVIGARSEIRAGVLAQLRRIYDGSLRREFGHTSAAGDRHWEGRMTSIAAVTPEIDRHYAVSQSLGERFLQMRTGRPGGREAAIRAMRQAAEGKAELKQAVQKLFQHLPEIDPAIPTAIEEKLASLAEYVARARSHVARSGYNKQLQYIPEPEAPTRVAQQLAQLAKGSALLSGRSEVSEEDYAIAKRAGLDSILPVRRKVLDTLLAHGHCENLGISRQTRAYAMEDLQSLGLLVEKHNGEFYPSELAKELAMKSEISPGTCKKGK